MSVGNFIQSGIREGVFTARTVTNLADKEGYIVRFTGDMSPTETAYPLVAIVADPTSDLIAGVLENGGDGSGTECTVSVRPLSTNVPFRCVAGGTISAGQLVTVKSDGTVGPCNAGDMIIGRAMEAATATTTVSGTTVLYVKVMGNPMGAYSTSYTWWTGTGVTLTDTAAAFTFTTGATNGATFGSATTDKVSLFGVTPVVQPANTADLKDAMIALGLVATGGATPLNLDGGALTTSGAASLTGGLTTAGAFKWEAGTIAADGTVQGDATAIAKTITYATAADGAKGVKLPAAAAGLVYIVYNQDANVLKLYPNTSDKINAGSANVNILVPGYSTAVCVAIDAEYWAVGLFGENAGRAPAKIGAVTAAGSGQGDGLMTDQDFGAFVNATGGDGTKVITLPAAALVAGFQCEIYNNSGSNLPVFPPSGGAINGGAGNASVTIATYTVARVVTIATNTIAISEQAKA